MRGCSKGGLSIAELVVLIRIAVAFIRLLGIHPTITAWVQ